MRTTQQLSITLPKDMADAVKAKVRTGEYASESEVIRDGLRALIARAPGAEGGLRRKEARKEGACLLLLGLSDILCKRRFIHSCGSLPA